MIRNVLIDLDDTILDFHKAESLALRKTLIQIGVDPTERILDRYKVINLAHWKRLERGELTRKQVQEGRYQVLFAELGIDFPASKATSIYEKQLAQGGFLLEGAEELLRKLSEKYRLYAVSNGSARVQEGRIRLTGIGPYFLEIFISEYIGFEKPSAGFFAHCFSQIPDFKEEESVIIGDSLTADIKGGSNTGVRTIWFNPGHVENQTDICPDYEVESLQCIPDLLAQM